MHTNQERARNADMLPNYGNFGTDGKFGNSFHLPLFPMGSAQCPYFLSKLSDKQSI
jgi:hypothetical protein